MSVDEPDEMDGLEVSGCERCPALCSSRQRIVNGVGDPEAALLFVGEAPGQSEDDQGEPFIGRSGAVLTAALEETGLDRAAVRITNCVRCRPPDNRDPHVQERANCRGYLDTEIELVDPAVIVTLGKVPGEQLLDRSLRVTAEAGSVRETRLGGQPRRVVISLHPAATLYDPSQQARFEQAIATAAELAGVGDPSTDGSGQARLGEY